MSPDLAVIGGGPAGMSAALTASGNRLSVRIFEAGPSLGGALHAAHHPIADLLGIEGRDGPSVAELLAAHVRGAGIEIALGTPIDAIEAEADHFLLRASDGTTALARAVLLATGTAPRALGVPGEELLDRRSIRDAAPSIGDRDTVVVIGGGDEAAYSAAVLAERAARVIVLSRGALRARPLFAAPLWAHPRIEVREGAAVERIEAGLKLLLAGGQEIAASAAFLRIGAAPKLPRLRPAPRLGPSGVEVDPRGRTSVPGLYAAGDVSVEAERRYVALAIGQGAVVARAIEEALSGRYS
ncbi:MAG: NAD(P)/FAD-dependent oxidoreductase [Myxococcota bacterium]